MVAGLDAQGPFSPPAGQEGSTAIHKDSALFSSWAVGCEVVRGYMDVSRPEMGYASAGTCRDVIGKAGEAGVLSLGDGGYAILTFDPPIKNGPGWDFAVFENAFDDYFLELAFVEVSSDGENFYRFPSVSLTDTTEQVGTFGTLDATNIYNLAGKYRINYGVPFNLDELKNQPGLDVNRITHVKIIDVVGSILDEYATFDSEGNKINDPWPTPFPSGGFDLDAVGVINSVEKEQSFDVVVQPNPIALNSKAYFRIFSPIVADAKISVFNLNGVLLYTDKLEFQYNGVHYHQVNNSMLMQGVFIVVMEVADSIFTTKMVII